MPESLRHHEELATAIAQSGAMLDADTPYWDIRPNPRLPTLEIRATDVTADVDDSVALAVLIRALVTTSMEMASAGDPGPARPLNCCGPPTGARPAMGGRAPASTRYRDGFFRPAYRRRGSSTTSALRWIATGTPTWWTSSCAASSCRGTGTDLQRTSAARHGELAGAVDDLIALTAQT